MIPEPVLPASLQTSSTQLRCPVFDHSASPAQKISELESYLLVTAYYQGELSHERLDWLVRRVPLKSEWDHLVGWENLKRTRTEAGVKDAKRAVRPDLYDELEGIDWTVKQLSDEIDRLERDATKVSRAYSMLTGS